MKKAIIAVMCLIFLMLAQLCQANGTYPVTESDKVFFTSIQRSVLQDDTAWLSKALGGYPFIVNMKNAQIELKSEQDMEKFAKVIFNSTLKDHVRNQSPKELFKNWQGVMIGNGDIWFSALGQMNGTNITWKYEILAINVPSEKMNPVRQP